MEQQYSSSCLVSVSNMHMPWAWLPFVDVGSGAQRRSPPPLDLCGGAAVWRARKARACSHSSWWVPSWLSDSSCAPTAFDEICICCSAWGVNQGVCSPRLPPARSLDYGAQKSSQPLWSWLTLYQCGGFTTTALTISLIIFTVIIYILHLHLFIKQLLYLKWLYKLRLRALEAYNRNWIRCKEKL